MGRGPTLHVPGDREPWIETEDGRHLGLNTPEGRAYAESCGVRQMDFTEDDFRPLSNTPRQNHNEDPLVTDPRPIRRLNEQERQVILVFIQRGAYAAVAGFETWRGRDRWLYVDVLGVGRDADEAEKRGMPVGPIDHGWLESLRVVGTQLALRMLDPWGKQASDRGRW